MPSPLPTVQLGHTGLRVTRYCQGAAFRHLARHAGDPMAERVLRHCLDAGVNFFDTAYAYGWGGSEELLGRVLAGRREDAVICTKAPASHPPDRPDGRGAPATFTQAYLAEQVEGALQRLHTDYIDLYLLHQPDGVTPPEAICASMDALVQSGKVRYWGLSNHDAAIVTACRTAALAAGARLPAVIEDYYTMAGYALTPEGASRVRRLEREMFPVVRACGLGVIAFSPLDAGRLAPGYEAEPGSPLADLHAALDGAARTLGVGRVQVCVAWALDHPEVTSVLAGPECPDHVDEMLEGAALQLPPEVRKTLDAASAAHSRRVEAAGNKGR